MMSTMKVGLSVAHEVSPFGGDKDWNIWKTALPNLQLPTFFRIVGGESIRTTFTGHLRVFSISENTTFRFVSRWSLCFASTRSEYTNRSPCRQTNPGHQANIAGKSSLDCARQLE